MHGYNGEYGKEEYWRLMGYMRIVAMGVDGVLAICGNKRLKCRMLIGGNWR